jgi:hypothetical protein
MEGRKEDSRKLKNYVGMYTGREGGVNTGGKK